MTREDKISRENWWKTTKQLSLENVNVFALSQLPHYFSHPRIKLEEIPSEYKHQQAYDVFEDKEYRGRVELRYSFKVEDEENADSWKVQIAVWAVYDDLSQELMREIPNSIIKKKSKDEPYPQSARKPIRAALISQKGREIFYA